MLNIGVILAKILTAVLALVFLVCGLYLMLGVGHVPGGLIAIAVAAGFSVFTYHDVKRYLATRQ